jgi:AraC-like DNA-binding protein
MNKKNELIEFICKLSINTFEYNTKVPIGNSWVLLAKENRNKSLDFITYEPVICIIIQGEKEVISSGEVVHAGVGQTLIITHDINVQARIKVVRIDRPYLAIVIPIDVQKLRGIALKMSFGEREEYEQSAISVGTTSYELEDAVLRYLRFLHRPQEMEILANSVLREIYFRVLTSEGASMLQELLIADSHADKIHRAVTHIKSNYSSDLSIKDLAKLVGMSTSSFHAHFRKITRTTPKKMQSDLRLMKVRDRLSHSGDTVSNLAFEVGYNSLSHLSKEYKEKFGRSPLQDRTREKIGNTNMVWK